LKNKIVAANGSVQGIDEIPSDLKEIYKTVWEIKQRVVIDMEADRGAFICQSQSLNVFIDRPNFAKLTSMHFYAWKRGLKTGMYYLRTKAAAEAIKFTVETDKVTTSAVAQPSQEVPAQAVLAPTGTLAATGTYSEGMSEIACSLDDPDSCVSCSG
jgi:ribonucleoside-diphosphate reductase alpha chain